MACSAASTALLSLNPKSVSSSNPKTLTLPKPFNGLRLSSHSVASRSISLSRSAAFRRSFSASSGVESLVDMWLQIARPRRVSTRSSLRPILSIYIEKNVDRESSSSSTSGSTFKFHYNYHPRVSVSPRIPRLRTISRTRLSVSSSGLSNVQPLDLTEENVRQVLAEARLELSQLFDDSVGITGQVELAELDGPFVTISLKGRFWHKRSTVVARLGNYLKQRIPEILEVDIEDDKQLDDSPASF